ncbi:MAG TPA: PH domain-containing protein [Candidatus Avipropionibacterium avicola]|uniref:PH domain-containing protein n=1 Tax=Candidatus Avipropionibacterium avicola TaxID=2840701 RepID=A0A9D1KLS9_9ACTN|nr:PH domain-containing protein [Candidatus Avipropionibacterium avicola]
MAEQTRAHRWRPRVLIITAIGFSVVFIGGSVIGWFAFPPEIRAMFQPFQILTLLMILAVILVLLWLLARSWVGAEESGLVVRNPWRRRTLAWSEIRSVVLRPGDPWAVAVLRQEQPDGEPQTLMLFGLQGSEGEVTRRAVAELNQRVRSAQD